tara:strand:- start:410 stop:1135 length:726 start_codon:yes stop_codon:yes gene_type:complete
MAGHLYNGGLEKVRWFVRRFGFLELLRLPVRKALSPWVRPRLKSRRFSLRGREWDCVYHDHNVTWSNERCVEVGLGLAYFDEFKGQSILEVGNVMSHYADTSHPVVDKYEHAPGVINEDIVAYRTGERFDLVFSISTLEHIGFDDDATGVSAGKILDAIDACKALLAPGGRFAFTVPIGYNPDLDELIRRRALGMARTEFLIRRGPREWEEASHQAAIRAAFGSPYPYANALLIAEHEAPR